MSELATMVQTAVRRGVPGRVWVVGEISGIERAKTRRHWFFQLIETDEATGRRYSLDAVLWDDERRFFFGRAGRLKDVIEPKDGIEIRVLVQVDFPPRIGRLQLSIRDIDPAHTLGKVALEKRRLIERLRADGVFERQKALRLPEAPLRIGLLTARESAAYNDFVKELSSSPFAFRVLCFDARMQGEATARTVAQGLKALVSHEVEVIALVRGGGSVSDLGWFDREDVARAVAECPVPVLTGIGHEIDQSVADLAAFGSFKTPTAVAAHLVECAREARERLDLGRERLARVAEGLARERERLSGRGRELALWLADRTRELRDRLETWRTTLAVGLERRLAGERETVAACGPSVERTVIRQSERSRAYLDSLGRRVGSPAVLAPVKTERERVERVLSRAPDLAGRPVASEKRRLRDLERRAESLDPARVIRRGFAIVRSSDGLVIKDAAAVTPRQAIVIEMRDGDVAARAEGSTPRHSGEESR